MAKCGNILMNTSAIVNVVTMQHRRYYSKFPMKFPLIINVLMMQRRKRCTFDSPGLASESEDFLTTHITLGRLTLTQGYQKHNAYSVDYQ